MNRPDIRLVVLDLDGTAVALERYVL